MPEYRTEAISLMTGSPAVLTAEALMGTRGLPISLNQLHETVD